MSVGPERHISYLFCFYIIVHRVCVRLEVIAELRRELLLYEPVYDRAAQLFNALKAAACIIYREGRELIEQGSLERPFALLACGARRPFIVRCPAPADKADERGIALGKAGERDHGGGLFSVVDAPAEIILTVLCKREQVRGEPLQSNILRHAVEQSFANTCKLSRADR